MGRRGRGEPESRRWGTCRLRASKRAQGSPPPPGAAARRAPRGPEEWGAAAGARAGRVLMCCPGTSRGSVPAALGYAEPAFAMSSNLKHSQATSKEAPPSRSPARASVWLLAAKPPSRGLPGLPGCPGSPSPALPEPDVAGSTGAHGATWWLHVCLNLHHHGDPEVLRDPVPPLQAWGSRSAVARIPSVPGPSGASLQTCPVVPGSTFTGMARESCQACTEPWSLRAPVSTLPGYSRAAATPTCEQGFTHVTDNQGGPEPLPLATLGCLLAQADPGPAAAGQMGQLAGGRGASPRGEPATPAVCSQPAGTGDGAPLGPPQHPGPGGHHGCTRAHSRPHRPRWVLIALAVAAGVLTVSCNLCAAHRKRPRDREAVGLGGPQGTTTGTYLVRSMHQRSPVQPDMDNLETAPGGPQHWGRLQLSLEYDFGRREIKVGLKQATDLRACGPGGTVDPYARVSPSSQAGHRGTLCPTF
ncbi:hypothetical protein GH733_007756 [Mirounga leonina]|nr:hypothetical protein GH733_007756 [Mirounga leonina]